MNKPENSKLRDGSEKSRSMNEPEKKKITHRLGFKMLASFIGLSVISLALFGGIAIIKLNELGDYSIDTSSSLGSSATNDSLTALESLGESIIQQKAEDVARQLEIYIKANPTMNVSNLQGDTFFIELAVQQVGETGYTATSDVDSLICRFHSSASITDRDLHELSGPLPGFWSIMSLSEGGNTSSGYYDWEEPDGSMRSKYMYIAIVDAQTADLVTFSVAATTYIDEFSMSAIETQEKIDQATMESMNKIKEDNEKTQNLFIIALIAMVVVISISAITLSRRITGPVSELAKGARSIGDGDLDYKVYVKSNDELSDLALAFNAMALDLKTQMKLVEENTREKERIAKELQIAKDIQKSFLPKSAPKLKDYTMAGFNMSAKEVGGDFYDFIDLGDGKIGIVIADVSGKGIPAAIFMGLSKTLVRANTRRILDPIEALKAANSVIVEESKTGMFITMFYAVLDTNDHTLTYINAGHNPPLLLRDDDSEIALLKAKGLPLGVMEELNIESKKVSLKSNDLVFLYTDGVTEAVNKNNEEYDMKRLSLLLNQIENKTPEEIIQAVTEDITKFTGDVEQFDDITMVVLRSEKR